MDRALVVSVGTEAQTHLKDLGYVKALTKYGWSVKWVRLEAGPSEDPDNYDLVLWDGAIPEVFFRKVRERTVLVAMGGAGENISYYRRYRDRIRLATTSLYYFDEPLLVISKHNLSKYCLLPQRFFRLLTYQHNFRRYASPAFWRQTDIPFLYLPYASDPDLFHPVPGARRDLLWAFCGTIHNRLLIHELMKRSERDGRPYFVAANELGTQIRPDELNALYNRAAICPNEHWQGVFGRELNQRIFDLGMAGVVQVSDMQWLAQHAVGTYARFYAGKLASRSERSGAYKLLRTDDLPSREEVHEFFRTHHSFQSRVAAMSRAMKVDLTRGRPAQAGV